MTALALAGCIDGPTAGEVTVDLVTPNADDGAVMFTVQTAAPNQLLGATGACAACLAFVHAVSDTEHRVIVTGPLAAGPIARLQVSNTSPTVVFRVELRQVARRDYAIRATGGYGLTVQR